jgi:translation initiation factor 2A
VLVLTHTDTDTGRKSYYGETNLYYLSAVGNYDCRVSLDAQGPVHDISWAPSSVEFTVVYGSMPTLTNSFHSLFT